MEESFCALTHWHQVTVDYKGGLVHAASTDGPHLKLQQIAKPKAQAVFFPRVRILKLFPDRIVFSTLLCDFASVENKIMCIGIRRKIHVE